VGNELCIVAQGVQPDERFSFGGRLGFGPMNNFINNTTAPVRET
jgi:hypothetical protein